MPQRSACGDIGAKGVAACKQATFAQQAAGARRESGKVEMPRERPLWQPRREAMTALDPGLGREIFDVDPKRLHGRRLHGIQIGRWQTAAKGLDDGIGRRRVRHRKFTRRPVPVRYGHASRVGGCNALQCIAVIDEQAHRDGVFVDELPGEPPRNADIAIVVDNGTEDVPVFLGIRHGQTNYRAFAG